jgi:dihydrofolate reductase
MVIRRETTPVVEASMADIGATVMGRNMFGGGTGPWGEHPWNGWWGDNPPYHHPVFVLTHHPREPLVCEGGTTFTFVTDGIASATPDSSMSEPQRLPGSPTSSSSGLELQRHSAI